VGGFPAHAVIATRKIIRRDSEAVTIPTREETPASNHSAPAQSLRVAIVRDSITSIDHLLPSALARRRRRRLRVLAGAPT